MVGTKSISKAKLRPGKKVNVSVAKAMKQLTDLKSGHSYELLDSYDNIEEKYENLLKNMSYKEKREYLTMTVEQRAEALTRLSQQREKDIGASKQTIQTLKAMSCDARDFLRLCDLWNSGDPGVKKSKKVFEELEATESIPWDDAMTEAWRNRPSWCQNLRSALLHYAKQFVDIKRARGSDFIVAGERPVLKIDQDKVAGDLLGVSVMAKLESISRAVDKIDSEKKASQRGVYFPGCYNFCKIQQATSELRQIEFHAGGKMKKDEMYRRFPVLKPLPKIKVEDADVEPVSSSTRPPSPSLVDHKRVEAAEAKVERLRVVNDQQEEKEEEGLHEDGGGYDGEQGDVFRQVFGDEDGDEDGDEEMEEMDGDEAVGAEASEETRKTGETGETVESSDQESTSEASNFQHNDEDMMFAEAMAARDAAQVVCEE